MPLQCVRLRDTFAANYWGFGMDKETFSFSCELKSLSEADGTFEGYASMFDVVDNGMDVVSRGAFAKSIGSGRKVKML